MNELVSWEQVVILEMEMASKQYTHIYRGRKVKDGVKLPFFSFSLFFLLT